MIRCLHCNAETSNGLALCEACQVAVLTYLEFVPVYFRNLARWKPARQGSRTVPGSRIPAGVIPSAGDRIDRHLDEAAAELIKWALRFAAARPRHAPVVTRILGLEEAATVHLLCKLYEKHLTSIATTSWAGDFVAGIRRLEHQLRALTEQLVPGWYAGACRRCHAPTHVVPGLTWVTCGTCGVTTRAADRLDVVLREAADWIAPPMRLAEAVVVLVDTEQSVPRLYARIKKWGQRDQITSHRHADPDGDPVGPHRYRLGDVLARLQLEGATRLTTTTTTTEQTA